MRISPARSSEPGRILKQWSSKCGKKTEDIKGSGEVMECDRDFLTASREYSPLALKDLSENQTPTSCCLAVPALPLGLAATSKVPSGFKSPMNLDPPSSSTYADCSWLVVSASLAGDMFVCPRIPEPNEDRGVIPLVGVCTGGIVSVSGRWVGDSL